MKILFAASTMSHIRHFHLPYLQALQSQGHVVQVAAGKGEPCPYADQVFPLDLAKKMTALKNWGEMLKLRKILKQEAYDVVSVHTSLAGFFVRLACFGLSHVRVVYTSHGYLFDDTTPFLKRMVLLLAEKLVKFRTDTLLVMNEQDYQIAKAHKLCKEIVKTNGMGIDLARFYPCDASRKKSIRSEFGFQENDVVLLCIAEFSKRKNQTFLIESVDKLPEHVHMIFLGEGEFLAHCKSIANLDRVHFYGYQKDIIPFLHLSDAVVSASRYEGLPFNLMEAMACGLPIVASLVKGNEDLVIDGENGFLFTDSEEDSFVAAVNNLCNADRATLGANGLAYVQQFSLENNLRLVLSHYDSAFALVNVSEASKL